MTSKSKPRPAGARPRVQVPLCDLGLAPENLRFREPEDGDVPRLAETIRAAGLIYPPLVRKGRKGEAPFMVLDGRRRRFALLRLAADGVIAEDHPVDCLLAEDRAGQAAAAVLPNAEHAPVHPADVIQAIGKLRRSRLSQRAIADALGYDELEVKRLDALSGVHPDVLEAFRRGRLNLRQVRMFTRIRDVEQQAQLARQALEGYFAEHLAHSLGVRGRVTVEDERLDLVGAAAYAEAGGRISVDLFDELPAEVLDPGTLDELWRNRALAIAAPLADAGVALSASRERGYLAPEGLEHLPFIHWGALPDERKALFTAARERLETAAEALVEAGADGRDGALTEVLRARLEIARLSAGAGEVAAALLTPSRGGLDVTFYHRPCEPEPQAGSDDVEAEAGEREGEADSGPSRPAWRPDVETPAVEVDVTGVTHAQQAVRSAVATEGLMRDLADSPEAAVTALTAHLFVQLALRGGVGREETALQVLAVGGPRGGGPEDGLAGEIWARLDAAREAYLASGLRPIPYVAELAPADRLALLANLVAASLDVRETRTDRVRRAARAEAGEIAALCGSDLARRWTPGPGFLEVHAQAQLLAFLAEMGQERPTTAKRKAELVQAVAEAAAARRWIPDCLKWRNELKPQSSAASPDVGSEDGEQADESEMAEAA